MNEGRGGLAALMGSRSQILRSLIRSLTRGMVIKRRLPAQFANAPLFVAPDSQLKYLKPGVAAFDLNLLRIAQEFVRPDMAVWDVGANVGVFSIAAASLVKSGRVLAIEPDPWLAGLLRRSAALQENAARPIEVLQAAISDTDGVTRLRISAQGRASNQLDLPGVSVSATAGSVRNTELVATLTLDTLLQCERAPGLVKIDVEGAERLVLSGATRLLSQVRPILYMEVWPQSQPEITALLVKNGYALFDGARPRESRAALPSCVMDTLALPTA